MKKFDIENAHAVLRMIGLLSFEEGFSVEICHDNPDFNGKPDCLIVVNSLLFAFVDGKSGTRRYTGDTLFECLTKAMLDMPTSICKEYEAWLKNL